MNYVVKIYYEIEKQKPMMKEVEYNLKENNI